jgi:hypothetical protein
MKIVIIINLRVVADIQHPPRPNITPDVHKTKLEFVTLEHLDNIEPTFKVSGFLGS